MEDVTYRGAKRWKLHVAEIAASGDTLGEFVGNDGFPKDFPKKQEYLLDVQCALFNKIRTVYEQSMDLENTPSISE